MKITSEMLRRIIKEEMANLSGQESLVEGTVSNPIQITPEYLNKIIREEYAAAQSRQRLAEARRRRERRVD
jgi:hypothetical protein